MSDPPTQPTDFASRTQAVVDSALELKAEDILALDMRSVSSFADSFVIASGRSNRHVRSIAGAIIECIQKTGDAPIGVEGLDRGDWVLIDANDIIIHIFESESRQAYSLERLWSDAPDLELEVTEVSTG